MAKDFITKEENYSQWYNDLVLKGELPAAGEGKVFGAILSSSIDHGVTPPSALATLNSASTGAPLNASVASGILSINKFHGGNQKVKGKVDGFTEL